MVCTAHQQATQFIALGVVHGAAPITPSMRIPRHGRMVFVVNVLHQTKQLTLNVSAVVAMLQTLLVLGSALAVMLITLSIVQIV